MTRIFRLLVIVVAIQRSKHVVGREARMKGSRKQGGSSDGRSRGDSGGRLGSCVDGKGEEDAGEEAEEEVAVAAGAAAVTATTDPRSLHSLPQLLPD